MESLSKFQRQFLPLKKKLQFTRNLKGPPNSQNILETEDGGCHFQNLKLQQLTVEIDIHFKNKSLI